jgi:hypothetical protein
MIFGWTNAIRCRRHSSNNGRLSAPLFSQPIANYCRHADLTVHLTNSRSKLYGCCSMVVVHSPSSSRRHSERFPSVHRETVEPPAHLDAPQKMESCAELIPVGHHRPIFDPSIAMSSRSYVSINAASELLTLSNIDFGFYFPYFIGSVLHVCVIPLFLRTPGVRQIRQTNVDREPVYGICRVVALVEDCLMPGCPSSTASRPGCREISFERDGLLHSRLDLTGRARRDGSVMAVSSEG